LIISTFLIVLNWFLGFGSSLIVSNFIFSLGIIIGWLAYKQGNRQYFLLGLDDPGLHKKNWVQMKIGSSLRRIVFENNGRQKNYSFLCDFKKDEAIILQLTHRAYFPELCKSYKDRDFGIALYIKADWIPQRNLPTFKNILHEEAINVDKFIENPEYYVLNIGTNIRFGVYLIEVF